MNITLGDIDKPTAPQEPHVFPSPGILLPHLGHVESWVSTMTWTESILIDWCIDAVKGMAFLDKDDD